MENTGLFVVFQSVFGEREKTIYFYPLNTTRADHSSRFHHVKWLAGAVKTSKQTVFGLTTNQKAEICSQK